MPDHVKFTGTDHQFRYDINFWDQLFNVYLIKKKKNFERANIFYALSLS